MAKTPFPTLQSEDILSAHLNGVQQAVNKIEEVLNMKTASITGIPLEPVRDQEDPSFRYRIYEANIRNWLNEPAPIIYRNGEEVSSNEFQVFPAYGAVVFLEQQSPSDEISADVDYVLNESSLLEDIESMNSLDTLLPPSVIGEYISHGLMGDIVHRGEGSGLLAAANAIDVMPFFVPKTQSYDRLAVNVQTADTGQIYLGIYEDNGHCYPGDLIVDGGEVDSGSTGLKHNNVSYTLERGMYWLARFHSSGPGLTGVRGDSMMAIAGNLAGGSYCGYRLQQTYDGALPTEFPSGAELLPLGSRPALWVRRSE